MVNEKNEEFRVLGIKEVAQVKTKLVLEALADIVVEKRTLGVDRLGAPDLETHCRILKGGEQFMISVFNAKVPPIGSHVSSDYISEQADNSFFDQASSFSGRPIRSYGFLGPLG